jgi:TPR repeat protein
VEYAIMNNAQEIEDEPDLVRLKYAFECIDVDPVRACIEFQSLAELGSLTGMLYLGWLYQKGIGSVVDFKKAETWYRRAYEEKSSKLATYYLGNLYLDMKDYSRAQEAFTAGLLMEYAPAITCLGQMYVDGIGVSKDLEKARSMFEKATLLGHIFAKRRLAKLLMSGKFGLLNILRGCILFFEGINEVIIVGIKEGSLSDRIRS